MLTILHISDLHFGPPYLPKVGDALLQAAPSLAPNLIVASGDFTQRAKAKQFAEVREFLDRLPNVPLVVVPGNHDVPLYRVFERVLAPHVQYRRYISDQLNSVVRIDGATIVSLDTTAPWSAITNGRIRGWQLDFCIEAFRDTTPGAAQIVVAHHHFAPAPDYENEHDVMRGAHKALAVFDDCEVDLILGGHLHRSYIGNSLDVCPGRDRSGGIVIAQCGTTTSARGRARERMKNSFNVIQISKSTIHITHQMYFHEIQEVLAHEPPCFCAASLSDRTDALRPSSIAP